VKVTHECWFADGERIAYHGAYLDERGAPTRQTPFVGVFDVARDLRMSIRSPTRSWRRGTARPPRTGSRLVMDHQGGGPGLYLLTLDRAREVWQVEQITSVHSDGSQVHRMQWNETDPIWSRTGSGYCSGRCRAGSAICMWWRCEGK